MPPTTGLVSMTFAGQTSTTAPNWTSTANLNATDGALGNCALSQSTGEPSSEVISFEAPATSVPANAVIVGSAITITAKCSSGGGLAQVNGDIGNLLGPTFVDTSLQAYTIGDATTDALGKTATQWRNGTWQLSVWMTDSTIDQTVSIDGVQLQVWYTVPGGERRSRRGRLLRLGR